MLKARNINKAASFTKYQTWYTVFAPSNTTWVPNLQNRQILQSYLYEKYNVLIEIQALSSIFVCAQYKFPGGPAAFSSGTTATYTLFDI